MLCMLCMIQRKDVEVWTDDDRVHVSCPRTGRVSTSPCTSISDEPKASALAFLNLERICRLLLLRDRRLPAPVLSICRRQRDVKDAAHPFYFPVEVWDEAAQRGWSQMVALQAVFSAANIRFCYCSKQLSGAWRTTARLHLKAHQACTGATAHSLAFTAREDRGGVHTCCKR